MSKNNYTEQSITVLKGLEPVKERPGMYTRTDSPTHIIQEVIDNAADEALAGFANCIEVVFHADQSVSVIDNGRGIPVKNHELEGISVVELVFTRLHAGGKFNKTTGGAYDFAGGLHGVGISVTNALSKKLQVKVKRDGALHEVIFEAGEVVSPLSVTGKVKAKDTGTAVRVWPNEKYFEVATCNKVEVERLLRAKALLLPGISVTLAEEMPNGEIKRQTWQYPEGLSGYLQQMIGENEALSPVFAAENYVTSSEAFAKGEGAAFALVWLDTRTSLGESYVNLIPTPLGGTHEAGMKQAVFGALMQFMNHHNLMPRGVKIQSDDVFSNVAFVLSARILDPQFQGQTKEKLSSREALKLVSSMCQGPLELWLNKHVDVAKKIVDVAIRQAQSRMKSAKKIEKKKSSAVAILPGKLTDCESEDIRENELFLVEGDSAGGSAKMARDKTLQAVLPLRGKVLNSFETERDLLFANAEIHDISVAIGVDPHGEQDDADLSGLRYGKIAILSDADVDGAHIQVLLLTLFYRHFPALIKAGHIYVAQPPLFRVDVAAQGKSKPQRKFYTLDKAELHAILERLQKEGVREKAYSISRFKGLGEMNPEQLKDTTMNPDTRRLLQVSIPSDMQKVTEQVFVKLMAKSESNARRVWMEESGDQVEATV